MEMADYILQTGGKMQTVDLLSLYGAIHYSIMEMVTWFTSIVYSLQPAFYRWSAVCTLPSVCILPPVRSLWYIYLFMICSLKVKNASKYINERSYIWTA